MNHTIMMVPVDLIDPHPHNPRRDPLILRAFTECPGWFSEMVLARLTSYPDPESCWLWTAALTGGYGVVRLPAVVAPTSARVHRVVWLALRGQIEDGLVLDHDSPTGCHNQACANPNHLVAVTQRVNAVDNGTGVPALHAIKTHCPIGHPLAGDNLSPYQLERGKRMCVACNRESGRRQSRIVMQAARHLGLTKRQYVSAYGSSSSVARRIITPPEADVEDGAA